ncbi:MAG TPA: DUF488 domain-containing protein [Spirochaetes bacterium]|nr:DUF488 domain-containing protein [Spirochaetota bacterium]
MESGARCYEFVPYKYGCFSFHSYYDKRVLTKYGLLVEEEKRWVLKGQGDYLNNLAVGERKKIEQTVSSYRSLKGNDLLRYVYRRYPYYAINSVVAEEVLTQREYQTVKDCISTDTGTAFFTIGYEGNSFEHYMNRLIRNNVKMVCDVRRNPLSMKYGFSKKQLMDALAKLSIEYAHFPELGIESGKRKDLRTDDDYAALFTEYENTLIPRRMDKLIEILELLKQQGRIALTCFEADPRKCHRGIVAKKVTELSGNGLAARHL